MNRGTLIRISLYLVAYLGVPVIACTLPRHNETAQNAAAVMAIIYIFLFIPFGILKLIDYYRTNDGTSWFGRAFNLLFRVPLALFGLVCVVAGAAIIGWVLYNVFVKRFKEYTGPSYVLGLGSFGVGVPLMVFGWYLLRSVLRRQEPAPAPAEQEDFEHEEDDEEAAADQVDRPKT